jgi:hypothetical protein
VAGQSGSRFGVDRFLSWKPLVSLGDNSYALYLWHWPVLVLALAATGVASPNLSQGAAIIGAAIVLAVLTTRFVEKPLREWRWPQVRSWRTALVIAACCALLAGPVAVWQTSLTEEEAATAAQPRELNPGAAQLTQGNVGAPAPAARIIPAPAALDNDWAGIHAPCIDGNATPDPVLEGCRQEVPSGEITKRGGPRLGTCHAVDARLPLRGRLRDPERRVQRLQPRQHGVRARTPAGCRVHGGHADP